MISGLEINGAFRKCRIHPTRIYGTAGRIRDMEVMNGKITSRAFDFDRGEGSIVFDYGHSPQTMIGLRLHNGSSSYPPATFVVQYSDDAKNWTTVGEPFTASKGGWCSTRFRTNTVQARYWSLKIVVHHGGQPWYNEVEFYTLNRRASCSERCIQAQVIDQLYHQFLQEEHCDMVFHVGADQHCIPAHKSIVCARSKYFQAQLSTEWADATPLKSDGMTAITVTSHSVPVFRLYLQYIYTGSFQHIDDDSSTEQLDMSVLLELYELARVFQDQKLMAMCLQETEDRQDVESTCTLYSWSLENKSHELETLAKSFMTEHFWAVTNSASFAQLMITSPHVLLHFFRTSKNEKKKTQDIPYVNSQSVASVLRHDSSTPEPYFYNAEDYYERVDDGPVVRLQNTLAQIHETALGRIERYGTVRQQDEL